MEEAAIEMDCNYKQQAARGSSVLHHELLGTFYVRPTLSATRNTSRDKQRCAQKIAKVYAEHNITCLIVLYIIVKTSQD